MGSACNGSMTPMARSPLRVDAQGERLRLLHVHAHPDDEASKGAATTAKYVAEGVNVLVVTCTGGERGSILNPAMDRPDILANIADIRRQKWIAPGKSSVSGRCGLVSWIRVCQIATISSFPRVASPVQDIADAVAPLVEVIRSFRPHVMTTYDESGGYPHPDHIMCHKVSVAAFAAAGDPMPIPTWRCVATAQALLLVHLESRANNALHRAMLARGLESPYAERLRNWPEDPEHAARITTRIACADYFNVRDRALLAHATQVDPDGPWFAVPLDVHRSTWPTEEWELARTSLTRASPRTICSRESLSRRRVESQHDPPRRRPECGPAGLDAPVHHASHSA